MSTADDIAADAVPVWFEALGCESLNDGIDMQASDVDCGKARRRLCKNHGKIGAGQQDRLDPVALRKLACNAPQGGGFYRVCFLCIENMLIDIGIRAISFGLG